VLVINDLFVGQSYKMKHFFVKKIRHDRTQIIMILMIFADIGVV